jgi:hypothetical protein
MIQVISKKMINQLKSKNNEEKDLQANIDYPCNIKKKKKRLIRLKVRGMKEKTYSLILIIHVILKEKRWLTSLKSKRNKGKDLQANIDDPWNIKRKKMMNQAEK